MREGEPEPGDLGSVKILAAAGLRRAGCSPPRARPQERLAVVAPAMEELGPGQSRAAADPPRRAGHALSRTRGSSAGERRR